MKNYFSTKGQSILELAIFGSLLIGILGIIISYGLNANYQQKAQMQAQRKMLSYTYTDEDVVSYVAVSDKHVPHPLNPFGTGYISPITASAGITRNPKMNEVATTEDELPKMVININGEEKRYDAAAFWYPPDEGIRYYPPKLNLEIAEDIWEEFDNPAYINNQGEVDLKIKKYEEVFGYNNVCIIEECGAVQGDCVLWDNLGKEWPSGEEVEPDCAAYELSIKIIDDRGGQIMSYDSVEQRCGLITNEELCVEYCQRGGKESSECQDICAQDIEEPWYCEAQVDEEGNPTGQYLPKASLFNFSTVEKYKIMGVWPIGDEDTIIENQLNKTESPSGINVTDNINWAVTTHRKIHFRELGDESGNYLTDSIDTTVSQDETWEDLEPPE